MTFKMNYVKLHNVKLHNVKIHNVVSLFINNIRGGN